MGHLYLFPCILYSLRRRAVTIDKNHFEYRREGEFFGVETNFPFAALGMVTRRTPAMGTSRVNVRRKEGCRACTASPLLDLFLQGSIPASPDTARPGHLSGKGKTDEADGADETDELGELGELGELDELDETDETDETDEAVSRGGEKNFCKIFLELMILSLPLYPQSDGLMPL